MKTRMSNISGICVAKKGPDCDYGDNSETNLNLLRACKSFRYFF